MKNETTAIDDSEIHAYATAIAKHASSLIRAGLPEEAALLRRHAAERIEKARREAAAADPRIQAVAAMARSVKEAA